jgi:flavin-dependent dehydrogenase
VDPISGEGICYALYSADILAKCIIENNLSSYQGLCMEHFGENLLEASQDFEYFYRAEFIETMIALAERSKPLQRILSEMIAGDINYLTWKTRFRKSFLRVLGDFIFNFEAATRKEVVTNLIRWYTHRPTSHPRHKIS